MSGTNNVSNPCAAQVPKMCREPDVETETITVEQGSRELTYTTVTITQDDGTTVVEEVIKRDGAVLAHKQHVEAEDGTVMTKVRREPHDIRCS